MKKIGFLSFGHWTPSSQSQTRSAADTLLQSIDLAVAAEELGADWANFRVHHFARQLASPFPLLAAVGVKTSRIKIGTAVIDMRYENPLYMAEDVYRSFSMIGVRSAQRRDAHRTSYSLQHQTSTSRRTRSSDLRS
jgi:Luciferase-like monooxygenase